MDNEYLEDLVSRARRMGVLRAEYGGDCYHVTIAMPDGGTRELDAFLFDGGQFTGDEAHDMALLPDAIEQTVDDMVENCYIPPYDPLAVTVGLRVRGYRTWESAFGVRGYDLDSESGDMTRASEALEPQDRNANELEGEMDR